MSTETATTLQTHGSNASESPALCTYSSSEKNRYFSNRSGEWLQSQTLRRRAAKACAACRARRVRCDAMQRYYVTADGETTCSNCTMDGIRCVIGESERRKKHLNNGQPTAPASAITPRTNGATQTWRDATVNPSDITKPEARKWNGSTATSKDHPGNDFDGSHAPHPILKFWATRSIEPSTSVELDINVNNQINRGEILQTQGAINVSFHPSKPTYSPLVSASIHGDRTRRRLVAPSPLPSPPMLKHKLPDYLKPPHTRVTSVDIDYLVAKGALSLPDIRLRNALLRSFFEYVHPYLPLVEIHELLQIIDEGTGKSGQISSLLFQAVMFAGTAFVDMEFLRSAGYSNRKAARKAFFQKARLLYDFDYEMDSVSCVQSLLLMTYWYETPDGQKDTWNWMGLAISLAQTIGLNRNPEKSNIEPNRKKLWKRIWWSCLMRDRLVSLGMGRPTMVKDEDYDVPMLTEDDFELQTVSETNSIIPHECTLARDVETQRELAQMCMAKAKLCLCISHILAVQYSALVKRQGVQDHKGSTISSVMLQTDEITRCDNELSEWVAELPSCCLYSNRMPFDNSGPPLFVQRSLLHMVYFTILSTLHRPQALLSTSTSQTSQRCELQDLSRNKAREASRNIARISQDLHTRGLEKYLPTTGVTVIMSAVITHLLDIKSCHDDTRQAATDGLRQCMLLLEKLGDNYASADFATQLLEAAMRKAHIDVVMGASRDKYRHDDVLASLNSDKVKKSCEHSRSNRRTPLLSGEELVNGMRLDLQGCGMIDIGIQIGRQPENDVYNVISARTLPDSDDDANVFSSYRTESSTARLSGDLNGLGDNNINFNDFLNFDTTGHELRNVALEDGAQEDSGGFIGGVDWIDQVPGWNRPYDPTLEEDLFEKS